MSKNLIIYFSRADENYSVGYIDKGIKILMTVIAVIAIIIVGGAIYLA